MCPLLYKYIGANFHCYTTPQSVAGSPLYYKGELVNTDMYYFEIDLAVEAKSASSPVNNRVLMNYVFFECDSLLVGPLSKQCIKTCNDQFNYD